METPERIWMFADGLKQYMPGGGKIMMGDTEYVRADIHAATVLRLTAELADTLAANAALVTRLDEAIRLMNRGLWLTDDGPAARAFLAGEARK